MKNANWIRNTNMVRVWAETQEDCQQLQAINLSLQLGDMATDDDLRSTYWTAIRSIGSTLEGFPKARPGNSGGMSEKNTLAMDSIVIVAESVFASIPTEHHAFLLNYLVPHGRTGGVYETFEHLVADQIRGMKNYVTSSLKDKRVTVDENGDFVLDDNGLIQITPRPTKTNSSTEVTEEE